MAQTLKNALNSGRVAHAYLFSGPRGTGKTSTGRLLGKALNCSDRQNGEPCNACESCRSFLAGRAMDMIELDAASNRGIDEIRSLRDKVAFAPSGAYKVYLIDEVHMLTDAAFNALLKTLEEPPPQVVFILATTEAHKLPATIASRCQRFDFRRIPLAASVANLQRVCEGEGISCEPAALELIARMATGSLRDAQNVLDQLATSYGKQLTLEHVRTGLGLIGDERSGRLARLVLAGDLGSGLSLIASVRDDGLDLRQFQRELVDELRALLMVKSGLDPEDGATAERRRDLQDAVAAVPTPRLLAALRAFGEADLKADPNSTLPLDIALADCVLAATEAPAANVAATLGLPPAPQPSPSSRPAGGLNPQAPPSPARPEPARDGSPQPAPFVRPEPAGVAALTSAQPDAAAARAAAPEAPAAEPGSEALPAGDDDALVAVRRQLRPIYDGVKDKSKPLAAMIGVADIIAAEEGAVVFGFKFPDHATKASSRENLEMLTQIVAGALGRPVEVRCVHSQDVRDWMGLERSAGNPLVRAAQEMGARVMTADPERPPYQGLAADPEDLQ